jgi:hypothetical protein
MEVSNNRLYNNLASRGFIREFQRRELDYLNVLREIGQPILSSLLMLTGKHMSMRPRFSGLLDNPGLDSPGLRQLQGFPGAPRGRPVHAEVSALLPEVWEQAFEKIIDFTAAQFLADDFPLFRQAMARCITFRQVEQFEAEFWARSMARYVLSVALERGILL